MPFTQLTLPVGRKGLALVVQEFDLAVDALAVQLGAPGHPAQSHLIDQ
jgi:hypothetical protein